MSETWTLTSFAAMFTLQPGLFPGQASHRNGVLCPDPRNWTLELDWIACGEWKTGEAQHPAKGHRALWYDRAGIVPQHSACYSPHYQFLWELFPGPSIRARSDI